MERRGFLKLMATGLCAGVVSSAGTAQANAGKPDLSDAYGMLVDTTLCVGCRHCEWACKKSNGFEAGSLDDYRDPSVFSEYRRPTENSYTVVNAFKNPNDPNNPIYAKVQCMHCEDPGCASACIVGALKKDPSGAVTYDGDKCIGCRYCMVACPFQIPAYEYHDALAPVVQKCSFCMERTAKEGGIPACADICPKGVLTYGRRDELLEIARQRIQENPDKYVDHIYGEKEVGGTSWLYLSSIPFEDMKFLTLGEDPVGKTNETVQHSLFKGFVPPAMFFGFLGAIMWSFKKKDEQNNHSDK